MCWDVYISCSNFYPAGEFGIALVLLTIALAFECNRWAVVALFSVGQFVYGATAAGFMVNSMDIAPRYTGKYQISLL